MKVSVVSPVYGCAGCIKELHRRVMRVLEPIVEEVELVLVDDASLDGSWEGIMALAESDPRVVGIELSRNFGQHMAITAGLDHCSGDFAVVLDCDLQDRPEAIPALLSKALDEEYDVVFASRVNRKDRWFKRVTSRLYGVVFGYLAGTTHDSSIGNFSIIHRRVINAIGQMRERDRAYPLLVHWTGFRTAVLPIEHSERFEGRTTYTLRRMVRLATQTVIAHSNKPLILSVQVGLVMAMLAISYASYLVIRYFFYNRPPEGWTSVIVSEFFIGGLIMANLGVLGVYLGHTFDESKRRPLYLIRQKLNCPERSSS